MVRSTFTVKVNIMEVTIKRVQIIAMLAISDQDLLNTLVASHNKNTYVSSLMDDVTFHPGHVERTIVVKRKSAGSSILWTARRAYEEDAVIEIIDEFGRPRI